AVAATMSVSAFAAERTDAEYLDLISKVDSVKATVEVKTLEPTTAGGFAAFFMQNQGGDWAWFASADEAATTKLTGAGTYEVAWTDVQSVITADGATKLYTPVETWEAYPSFGIQIGSDGIAAEGDAGKIDATVTDVVITFTDGKTITIDEFDVAGDLLGKQESWGMSGNNVMFNMVDLLKAADFDAEEEPNGDVADPEDGKDDEDKDPGTGLVGLSVAGLAVAGAAVVATKKRK
ncbi:MAG: hypothetical protein IJ031_08530, partial [Oscillospiraceae bacterium]|nr:hypothetical protein [Oscillospiraceae bacterium]